MASPRYRTSTIEDKTTAKIVTMMIETMLLQQKEAAISLHGNTPSWAIQLCYSSSMVHTQAAH